ncbi:MAG: hypothetical protein WCR67_01525 [Bacilli bacterium]
MKIDQQALEELKKYLPGNASVQYVSDGQISGALFYGNEVPEILGKSHADFSWEHKTKSENIFNRKIALNIQQISEGIIPKEMVYDFTVFNPYQEVFWVRATSHVIGFDDSGAYIISFMERLPKTYQPNESGYSNGMI